MLRRLALIVLTSLLAWAPQARADGVTQFHDDARTGWYADQPALTRGDVQDPSFGPIFSASVHGQVYAQPLVSNGILLVTTEENEVYGLGPATGQQRWNRTLEAPFDATAPPISCSDLAPHVGSTATPVIDPAGTGTAYLTTKDATGHWRLHALDVQTGAERSGFPVRLEGIADNQPTSAFDGTVQMQRPALLLRGGVVYAAFASHCDAGRFGGWVFGVSTAGSVRARWRDVPAGTAGGGIWQSGAGLAADDAGRIFLATGNGFGGTTISQPTDGEAPPAGLAQSVVRLGAGPSGALTPQSFFAPSDVAALDENDADFGSGGPVLLPDSFGTTAHPHLLAVGGKAGLLYLLDRDHLGGFRQGPAGGDASVAVTPFHGAIFGKPSIWPGGGGWLYVPGVTQYDTLDFYKRSLDGQGRVVLTRWASTAGPAIDDLGPGTSSPIVTSNATSPGSALVWVTGMPYREGAGARLRVYDAEPAVNSTPAPLRSWSVGTGSRYAAPGVGDGRIYVGTVDGHVLGFGRPAPATLRASGTDLGTVVAGTTSDRSVVLTAQRSDLTITGTPRVDATGGFAVGPGYVAPGHALADGESFTVPVRLSAGGPPGGKGSTLRVPTSAGEVLVSLSAQVRAAGGYLVSSPPVLGIGGVAVGRSASGQATFTNAGGQPLHLTLAHRPIAPFVLSGLPDELTGGGSYTLAPGTSFTASVGFAPTARGAYADEIRLGSDGDEPEGNRNVGLTGAGETPSHLSIEPATVAFGPVVFGTQATRTVLVRNTGGAALHLLKYKPPAGGTFTLVAPLDEGSTLQGGQSVLATVRFAPPGIGPAAAHWMLTGDDGAGGHDVALTGAGVGPPVQSLLPPGRVPATVRLSALRVVPGWFRVSRHRQPFAGRHGSGRLTFKLSRGATLRCSVVRLGVPARGARRGGFILDGRRGANLWWLSGRLRGRPLSPGRYRLVLTVPGGRSHSATFGLQRR